MGSALHIGQLILLTIERILYFVYCQCQGLTPLKAFSATKRALGPSKRAPNNEMTFYESIKFRFFLFWRISP
jgi:hypothetical protein